MYIELLAAKNVADAKRLRILYDLAEDALLQPPPEPPFDLGELAQGPLRPGTARSLVRVASAAGLRASLPSAEERVGVLYGRVRALEGEKRQLQSRLAAMHASAEAATKMAARGEGGAFSAGHLQQIGVSFSEQLAALAPGGAPLRYRSSVTSR